LRWCYIPEFNPNSGKQLIEYMKAKGYKVPKSRETDEDGKGKDTTAKKELMRLATRHSDNFFLKTIEYRELSKMRGTYIEGFKPHADGRVHTTFTFDTGTGQLSSRNPNCQNFVKSGRLAKAVRKIIAAPPGHVLVEWDYKSYHVLTTGFCAEDAAFMRMARLDMHSFVAGCFLKCWTPNVMEESDASLLDRFKWFRGEVDRKRVRDKQAKPTILGVGFGMGARRLYQENLEHFSGERVAKQFLDLLQHLFPRVFDWQRRIRQLAHDQSYLRSPFGHIRRFYEVFVWDHAKGAYKNGDQAEEAVAFLPANCAFGNIRCAMKELARRELDRRYGLANTIHDSLVFIFPRTMLGQHVAEVYPILTAPSTILRHPTLAPDGLSVDVEACVGTDWSAMAELRLPSLKEASNAIPALPR
jgi:DNA polymerase I